MTLLGYVKLQNSVKLVRDLKLFINATQFNRNVRFSFLQMNVHKVVQV